MDTNDITRHYQLKLMNDFMNFKYQNPKLKQSEKASQIKIPTSSIQRQRIEKNMNSPYRFNPNNVKKRQKKSKLMKMVISIDFKWLQKTSRQLHKQKWKVVLYKIILKLTNII